MNGEGRRKLTVARRRWKTGAEAARWKLDFLGGATRGGEKGANEKWGEIPLAQPSLFIRGGMEMRAKHPMVGMRAFGPLDF